MWLYTASPCASPLKLMGLLGLQGTLRHLLWPWSEARFQFMCGVVHDAAYNYLLNVLSSYSCN